MLPCKKISTIILLLFTSLIIQSCKKENDSVGPVIKFSQPQENQNFNVFDVITVSGSIIDDNHIESVSIQLVNENNVSVLPSLTPLITSPTMNFSIHYPLDDIHLESGSYYLLIMASDGRNLSKSYLKIHINEIPRKLNKIFLVSELSSTQTRWSYIDTTFSVIMPYYTFFGDYIGSSVSGYFQQVYNCGNYTGDFTGFHDLSNSVKFTIPAVVSSMPYFTSHTFYDKNVYVARYDEFIKGYDFEGNSVYNSKTMTGNYVVKFVINDGWMITQQRNKITGNNILVVYYPSGLADVQTSISQEVIEMIIKDKTNTFMFGNYLGQAKILLYDRLNNNLWSPYPFSIASGSMLSAVKIDNDTYLFGHSNGTIYKYQFQNSSITPFATGYLAKCLLYDQLSSRLFVGEKNSVSILDYSTKNVISTCVSNDTITSMHLLFNR